MGKDKEQIAFRVTPQMKREIDLIMYSDGSRTRNEFLEHAVKFYIDHLLARDMSTLPVSVASAIDGRLGMLEDRLSALQFNNSVEMDLFPWKRPCATDTASSSSATAVIPRPRHAKAIWSLPRRTKSSTDTGLKASITHSKNITVITVGEYDKLEKTFVVTVMIGNSQQVK